MNKAIELGSERQGHINLAGTYRRRLPVVGVVVGLGIAACAVPDDSVSRVTTSSALDGSGLPLWSPHIGDGSSATDPVGPNTTRAARLYERVMLMAAARYRSTLPITWDADSSTFSTTDPDAAVNGIVDLLNDFPVNDTDLNTAYHPRLDLGTQWSAAVTQLNTILTVMNDRNQVSAASVVTVQNGYEAWEVDPETRFVIKAPVYHLRWQYTGGADNYGVTVGAISNAAKSIGQPLAMASRNDGDVTRVINGTNTSYEYDPTTLQLTGWAFTEYDPPSDGIDPSNLPTSVGGSGTLPQSTSGIGCLTTGTLGQSCTLQPFTPDFPNYVNSTYADNIGVDWIALSVQSVSTSKCASGLMCRIRSDGAWTSLDFQWTGDNDLADPVEWDFGYYKGDCGDGGAIGGLSINTSGITPHAILCRNYGAVFTGAAVATLSDVTNGNQQRASRGGDWAPGYYKSECGVGEYMSGVSQSMGGRIHGIRCASGPGLTNGGQNDCEVRGTVNGSQGSGSVGDWDYGYWKSECSAGKVVFGVSTDPSSGQPSGILCCDK